MKEYDKRWLRGAKAAAQYCGVSARQISRWCASGRLRHRKLGHKLILFQAKDLDACIEHLAEDYAVRKGM